MHLNMDSHIHTYIHTYNLSKSLQEESKQTSRGQLTRFQNSQQKISVQYFIFLEKDTLPIYVFVLSSILYKFITFRCGFCKLPFLSFQVPVIAKACLFMGEKGWQTEERELHFYYPLSMVFSSYQTHTINVKYTLNITIIPHNTFSLNKTENIGLQWITFGLLICKSLKLASL